MAGYETRKPADLVGQIGDVAPGFILRNVQDKKRAGEMMRQVLDDGKSSTARVCRADQAVRNGHRVLQGGAQN